MTSLVAAAVFFVVIHIGVSGTGVRRWLVARIGDGPYMGLFSLASLGGMIWLSRAYGDAPTMLLWTAPVGLIHAGVVVMALAIPLAVIGLTTPSPTTAMMEDLLEKDDVAQGILRITRHPFLMGVALWALFHLSVNGDAASVVLFFSLFGVAVVGAPSIDHKRRRKHGGRWDAFAARTSIVPFAAIAAGRNHLALSEIKAWQWAAAVGAYVALYLAHPYWFGVRPGPF